MNTLSKKGIARALVLAALATTSSLQSMMYLGLQERLGGLTKDEIRTLAADAKRSMEKSLASQPNFEEMARSLQNDSEPYRGLPVQKASITVGHDNDGQPIIVGYLKAGLPNHNLGTILCSFEGYFGREAYRQQLQQWALKGYQAYSFELLSLNEPTAMEGIGGFQAYSFQQYAYLLHLAIVQLNIPTNAQSPITLTGLDNQGTTALIYAHQYKDDPYAVSYLILESADYFAITSDDPCKVPLLSVEFAEILAELYDEDHCGILCLLYSGAANQAGNPGNFTEVRCQSFGTYLLNLSVRYGAATTPTSIFRQHLAVAFQFNPAPLMQDIEIPVLLIYSGIYQLLINKQVNGIGFYGFCSACQAGCTDVSYILPFQNSIIQTFQDAGLVTHVVRSKPFNDAVTNFISGDGGKCDPYFGIHVDVEADCVACPAA